MSVNRQVACRVPRTCRIDTLTECSSPRMNRVVVLEKTACKEPYRNRHGAGSIYGTPIKVCTGRIRGVCPPGICDCPVIKCQKPGDKVKRFLWVTLKLGVVLVLIFETWVLGIWSDAEKTAQLSHSYMDWAKDFFWTRNKINRTDEEKYDMARITYNMKNVWNNIHIWLNSVVHNIPVKTKELGNYIMPRHSTAVDPKAKPKPA